LPLATGCLSYEWKYELFTRNEIGAGAKYFQDSTAEMTKIILMYLIYGEFRIHEIYKKNEEISNDILFMD
jgi:hypothetical protein